MIHQTIVTAGIVQSQRLLLNNATAADVLFIYCQ